MDKQKYFIFYKKLRELIPDEEIFPDKDESFLAQFISQENWMGIPSFGVLSKDDLTKTNNPHISINLRKENTIHADIFYNGKNAVEKFCNILSNFSAVDKKKFIDAFKKLDEHYSYELLHDERLRGTTANWKLSHKGICNQLDDNEVEKLLSKINNLKNERVDKQKGLKKGHIATIAIKLAEVEIDIENNGQIIEVFSKLISILRILVKIKSTAQIRKLSKESEKRLQQLKEELEKLDTPQESDRIILAMNVGNLPKEDVDRYINRKKEEIKEEIQKLERKCL